MNDYEEQPLEKMPIVVIDTETTGLYPGLGHRITEVGLVRFENWQPVAQMSQLVQPGRPIDPQAAQVSGIDDEDLIGQPTFAEIADDLLRLLDGALLVAHNATFDAAFIGLELWLAGHYKPPQPQAPVLANPWLCTLRLARRHFYFGRNRLTDIARRLNVRIGRAHRALNDVHMTAEILKRMARELSGRGWSTVGDYLYAQQGAIFTPPPPVVELLPPLGEALQQQQTLDILYVDRASEMTQRRIVPLYATYHESSAYLIAHCLMRGEQRSFRVDRIFSATLVEG